MSSHQVIFIVFHITSRHTTTNGSGVKGLLTNTKNYARKTHKIGK